MRLAALIGKRHDLVKPAFKRRRALGDARRLDQPAWRRSESRKLELIDVGRHPCGREIHLFAQLICRDIDGELAGRLDRHAHEGAEGGAIAYSGVGNDSARPAAGIYA